MVYATRSFNWNLLAILLYHNNISKSRNEERQQQQRNSRAEPELPLECFQLNAAKDFLAFVLALRGVNVLHLGSVGSPN